MQAFDADAPQQASLAKAQRSAAAPSTSIGAHEVLSLVMPHLAIKDRATLTRVSRKWRDIAVQQRHLWRTVDAGKTGLRGWDGLCHLVHTCNVGALKASIAFQPDYFELMKMRHDEEISDGPKRMALLLNSQKCTSLTSLHLRIDNSGGNSYNFKPILQFTFIGKTHNSLGIVDLPTSLRQLKLEFDCLVYLLIPNIAQLTALTALSCHIDGSWEENLPKAFPASLKRLEMYNSHCPPILPPNITTISRLENLQLIGSIDHRPEIQFNWKAHIYPAISPVLSLLDVQEGKEEHDEWCRHLTYLGFYQKVFKGLPKQLPPALVTVELIYPDIEILQTERAALEACLASHTALHNLSQLRRFTYSPFQAHYVGQMDTLRNIEGLEVLELRVYDTSLFKLPRDIPALHSLKHLSLDLDMLDDYSGFFSDLTSLETLKLVATEVGFEFIDLDGMNYESDDSDALYDANIRIEDIWGWMDDGVLDALKSCPRLKAVYTDNYRLRYIWGVPATERHEPVYRDRLTATLEDNHPIMKTSLAIAVALGSVPLLPEKEWESGVGYGKQWTPWDQVE